jgi:hypothetical protein
LCTYINTLKYIYLYICIIDGSDTQFILICMYIYIYIYIIKRLLGKGQLICTMTVKDKESSYNKESSVLRRGSAVNGKNEKKEKNENSEMVCIYIYTYMYVYT